MDIRQTIVEHSKRISDRCISVPEWGLDKLYLRRMSIAEFEALQSEMRDQTPEARARIAARLLVSHCVDEDSKPVFDFPDAVQVLVQAETSIVNGIALMISGDMPLLNTARHKPGEESEEEQAKNA